MRRRTSSGGRDEAATGTWTRTDAAVAGIVNLFDLNWSA